MGDQPTAEVDVEQLLIVKDGDVDSINRLLPQLSKSAEPLTLDGLRRIIDSEANRMYVARTEGGVIVGFMLFVVVVQPTGTKCLVEDVVVDGAYRKRGIASEMIQYAIDDAPEEAKSVNLTTKPGRGAYHVYERLGFRERETLVYRLTLEKL